MDCINLERTQFTSSYRRCTFWQHKRFMKKTVDKRFTFTELVSSIQSVHNELLGQARRAVNISLTLRNWLIGCYIAEYEMRGADRAKYGDRLMDTLAETLTKQGVSRCDRRELYRYRQFYLMYPQIVEALTPQFMPFLLQEFLLELPKQEDMQRFLEEQIKEARL